jgi:AcrR family transcriptional regulator
MEQRVDTHDTERRILEAAERLFLEKGFAMTSTTEIAKEAECNQALVHYYYRTKDHLFEAIFEQKVYLFMTTFLEIDSSNDSFEEKLRKKIEAHFDILHANPKLPFLFVNELTTNPARIQLVKEKIGYTTEAYYLRFQEELKAEIEKGNIRPIDPVDLLLTVISLNAVLFLISPIVKIITNISDQQMQKLMLQRKAENVKIILNSLRP